MAKLTETEYADYERGMRDIGRLGAIAESIGLSHRLTEREVAGETLYGITVERPLSNASWSMAATEIAIGRSIDDVSRKAIAALKDMAPRLQAKLDAASPEPPETRIAAGVGSDGVVTALRVERDGSVRLHPDDIEAIAEAVYRRFYLPDDGHLPQAIYTWHPDGTVGPNEPD